jgi:predicted nuclease with TOPRIM domain
MTNRGSSVKAPILCIIPVLLFALLTGCEETKQLNREAAALKEQLRLLQQDESSVEDELQKATAAYATISNNPTLRKATSTAQQKRDTALAEVSALKKKREELQAEIDSLAKSATSFRQKYL